jgi:hypothetical protein
MHAPAPRRAPGNCPVTRVESLAAPRRDLSAGTTRILAVREAFALAGAALRAAVTANAGAAPGPPEALALLSRALNVRAALSRGRPHASDALGPPPSDPDLPGLPEPEAADPADSPAVQPHSSTNGNLHAPAALARWPCERVAAHMRLGDAEAHAGETPTPSDAGSDSSGGGGGWGAAEGAAAAAGGFGLAPGGAAGRPGAQAGARAADEDGGVEADDCPLPPHLLCR